MKKISSYIFLGIISSLLLASMNLTGIAYANNSTGKPAFEAPIIPKPSLLPGPEKDQLTDESGNYTGRKLLTEKVLPRYAVGLIAFVGGLSVLFIIIGGVRFTIAYGKEESVENAKKQVIYAIAGFIIALLSYTIVSIISNIKLQEDSGTGVTSQSGDGLFPAGQELDSSTEDMMENVIEDGGGSEDYGIN